MSRVYQSRAAVPKATATNRTTPAAHATQQTRPVAPSVRGSISRGTGRPTPSCSIPRANVNDHLAGKNIRARQIERTVQVGDGFQMFTPSNEKREQMRRQAEDEQRRYEAHVERTRLRSIHEVHRLGGNQLTEEEVRQRQAENYRREKFVRLEKAHQNRMVKKLEEEREIEERKQAARDQAMKNSQREINSTMGATGWTDEAREQDRKEVMNRYLDRLSQKTNDLTLESDQRERQNESSNNYNEQMKILRDIFPNIDDETLRSRLEIYEGNVEMIVQEFTE